MADNLSSYRNGGLNAAHLYVRYRGYYLLSCRRKIPGVGKQSWACLMGQANFVFLAILGAFLVFITARGELRTYAGFLI